MIGDLIAILVAHPTQSRTATSALQDLTESSKETATGKEIDALLQGTLTEEAYVRFACLQALSVSFLLGFLFARVLTTDMQPLDLTELDFPTALWIACHDVDERNAELALTLWQENGLDVPEHFLSSLIPHLCTLQILPSLDSARADHQDDSSCKRRRSYSDRQCHRRWRRPTPKYCLGVHPYPGCRVLRKGAARLPAIVYTVPLK
jgi:hypothetical protein